MRFLIFKFGRGGEIRTHGLLYPKQARYQTAPRPDNFVVGVLFISNEYYYKALLSFCQHLFWKKAKKVF